MTYLFLLAFLRLTGRRSINATTPFDFVVALVVGDMPDDMIWGDVPFAQGVVAIATVVLLHLLVEWLTYRYPPLERWLGGVATPILRAGAVQPGAAREHVNDVELDAMLRLQGIERRDEVAEALLEPTGNLSVGPRPDVAPATRRDYEELERAG